MKRSLIAALSLLAVSCGSTATTATTPTTTTDLTTLTFTSTLTANPVAGARVVVAGTAYTTGADGTIALSTPVIPGNTIDAFASGFLDRATVMRTDTAFTLWEIPAGADTTFVRKLAYDREGTTEVLWRPTSTAIVLQLTGDLAGDSQVRAAHVQAAAMATSMTGGRVTVLVGNPVAGGVGFTVQLNPSAQATATTYLTQTRGSILGGRMEYASLDAARTVRVIAHELGHALGFGHAPSGIMCPSACGVDTFGPLDAGVFTSMWQRQPGTAPLDNDRVLLASSAESEAVFNCYIR